MKSNTTVYTKNQNYKKIDEYILKNNVSKILLICGKSAHDLAVFEYIKMLESRLKIFIKEFFDFSPNPSYESVVKGVKFYRDNEYDMLIAIGGGSAIDTAKCIKLFSGMNDEENYLQQTIPKRKLPLLMAIPTTAGSGSEATKYAVIYANGEKQSVTSDEILPNISILDASTLKTLPIYQRKSTVCDALCHAIEACWSVNATDKSRFLATDAIKIISRYKDVYVRGENTYNEDLMRAANLAGQSINISQTTAAHAMSYKLTSLCGIAHGHAAMLCLVKLWKYMVDYVRDNISNGDMLKLYNIFQDISVAMGINSVDKAIKSLENSLMEWQLKPVVVNNTDIDILIKSVHQPRLKNNPIRLTTQSLAEIYEKILG